MWRHDPEKIKRVSDAARNIQVSCSRRRVARAIGYIVWDCYISCRPLCEISEHIAIMKTNAPSPGQTWDADSPATLEEITCLRLRLAAIELNPWRTHTHARGPIMFCASDSSDTLGGMVLFDPQGNITSCETMVWEARITELHIFLKELLAACITVERIITRQPEVRRIYLGCDNTAVCHVLQKFYSNNGTALTLVWRIRRALESGGVTRELSVVSLRGLDNVADCPSRSAPPEESRRLRTWRQLDLSQRGFRIAMTDAMYHETTDDVGHSDGVRHRDEIEDLLVTISTEEVEDSATLAQDMSHIV
jgi:hypothetical protein